MDRVKPVVSAAAKIISILAVVLTGWLATTITFLYRGGDEDRLLLALFAAVPVLSATVSSLVMHPMLRYWLGRQQPTGTPWRTFAGALLAAVAVLWLGPRILVTNVSFDYPASPLLWPVTWMNFMLPKGFWPLFAVGNLLGAGLGYLLSAREPARPGDLQTAAAASTAARS